MRRSYLHEVELEEHFFQVSYLLCRLREIPMPLPQCFRSSHTTTCISRRAMSGSVPSWDDPILSERWPDFEIFHSGYSDRTRPHSQRLLNVFSLTSSRLRIQPQRSIDDRSVTRSLCLGGFSLTSSSKVRPHRLVDDMSMIGSLCLDRRDSTFESRVYP